MSMFKDEITPAKSLDKISFSQMSSHSPNVIKPSNLSFPPVVRVAMSPDVRKRGRPLLGDASSVFGGVMNK